MMGDGLAQMLLDITPVLPDAGLLPVWLRLGWSLVLAALAYALLSRQATAAVVALLLAAWAWLPGPWSASHWLGLAFQAPSIGSVLWCAVLLCTPNPAALLPPPPIRLGLLVLGWALLLDTLALLPVSLYAWGFGPAAVVLLWLLALLPWLLQRASAASLALPAATLALFVALRLPSGNVFDAVLDPLLWFGLHANLIRYKKHSKLRL